MRTFILLLLSQFAISATLMAQEISGIIKDESGVPLAGTTISLVKAADSSIIKLAVSNQSGNYTFNSIKTGSYRIKGTHVGFAPVFSPVISLAADNIKVPDLVLVKASGNLKNVVITAQKPIV